MDVGIGESVSSGIDSYLAIISPLEDTVHERLSLL